jgi:hypothetical protein
VDYLVSRERSRGDAGTTVGDVLTVAERVSDRLGQSPWDTTSVSDEIVADTAAGVAVFALALAGKRRQARRGGRFGRLVVSFAMAACVALASVAAACDKPNASPEETQTAINALPSVSGTTAAITAQPRASPAQFTDLVLLDPGSDTQPWAVLQAAGSTAPILVDRVGAGLDSAGATYQLAASPVSVGTRDGPSQFLDPLQPAVTTGGGQQPSSGAGEQLEQGWAQDERYLAATRAIAGRPTVLDAAYNAEAAAAAGGTHTYVDGVVLRVEPDKPVLAVIDRALLESGLPTRAEDVVYVAIRASEQSLYNPGQVVNLRDVVINKQTTDVNGQSATVYVANAALDGARVEPSGSVDLQSLLQPRLQRVDQDLLAAENQAAAGATPVPTATVGGATSAPAQPVIVQQRSSGPSFIDDFLIWMWLSNSGFYRGPTVVINNPPPTTYRPSGDVYYSPPPAPASASPSSVSSAQAVSRSTALEASRSAVSGQASGTGGGVAATNKSAADATARVSAATAKSASVAADVSSSSAGKSISSAPRGSSTTASRSAGTTSAGTRGSAGSSTSSSSGSSSAGKGIGGASSSSGGGFGGKGSSSSSSS